ncbi:MAG: prepilin-type N-terminal cleavage/methylation domain-containing protein [Eubacterium sp.]|nr:prepilin-type N-terminal cleavage/methylation domain-containing protein [Eubacterium sp.]
MNILKNNKGVTLIELLVSLTILALLSTAVIGIMTSNTQVFRKNKTDIAIQTNAEEVYNKLSEDIMQARYIYVEGYLASAPLSVSTREVGAEPKDASGGTVTFTPIRLLKASDINLMQIATDFGSGDCDNYLETIVGSAVTDRPAVEQVQKSTMSDTQKDQFDSFYENVKNLEWYEARRYGEFVDYVKGSSTAPTGTGFTAFNSSSIKSITSGVNTYGNVYITKLVMEYSVPMDNSKVTDTSKIETYNYSNPQDPNDPASDLTANAPDYCIATYTFSANKMYVEYDYHAMDRLDTNLTDASYPENTLYSTLLNYVDDGTDKYSAVGAQFDAETDSFKLEMHFTDKKMNYTDTGMTKIRNSYVLHDAN